jgi:hypothetical protein
MALTPGATVGMTVSAPIAQPAPAAIVTIGMGPSVREGHEIGRHWRRGLGCMVSRSHRAQWGLVVKPSNGLGALAW